MIIPDDIADKVIGLHDQYFDLRGLSAYSSLGVSTLRDYIRLGALPVYKIKGKILIRKSEFDSWMNNYRLKYTKQDLDKIVDDVLTDLK